MKQAISVTLHRDNVTWLKGRVDAVGYRSVSELLDRLVTSARMEGKISPPRSVVGSIEIDPSDPLLEDADAKVRELFESSQRQPEGLRRSAPRRRKLPKPQNRK
jgi:hypothetical protein